MLQIKSKSRNYSINFPNTVDEIKSEDLANITSNIKLPKYHCIIALCYKTNIFNFVTSINNKRNTELNVIARIASISEEDSKEINACVGDKIITDRSSIERGIHLHLPISISSKSAADYIMSDNELVKDIIRGKYNSEEYNKNIIIMEFKIIPINSIAASIGYNNTKNEDPFIVANKDKDGI